MNLSLLYIVLCDAFSTEPHSGKKNFQGIFDRIFTPSFPATYPSLTIAAGLVGGEGSYEVGAIILDPNRLPVFRSPTVSVTPKDPYRREDIVMQVTGFPMTQPGRYEVQILIGGKSLGSYPLFVDQVTGNSKT